MLPKFIKKKENSIYICVIIMVVMTSIMMLLYNPLCPGMDFEFHFNRLYCLIDSFSDGTFPVYMDYYVFEGFGYLSKIFYSDFLLIPFAIVGKIFTPQIGMNTLIFVLTVLSGIFTYYALYNLTKSPHAGIIAGIFYSFATYRLIDVYIRSALGETFAITFLPLIIWGAAEIINGNYKKWYILSIGFSLLIYSHLISSLLAFITLIIVFLIYYKQFIKEPKRFYYLILSSVVCIVLCAYYLIPMIEQMLDNTFYYSEYKMLAQVHTYHANEIILGMFKGINHAKEIFFPRIGVVLILPLIMRIFVNKKGKITSFFDLLLILGFVYLFMTTHLFPWTKYPFNLFVNIQFSYRLNIFISLFFSFCIGYYISQLSINNKQRIASIIVIMLIHIITMNGDSTHYKDYICKNQIQKIDVNNTTRATIGAEYLPFKIPPEHETFFVNRKGKGIAEKENTVLSNFQKDKGHITFEAEVVTTDNVELPLTYYKGYTATLNNEPISYQQSENGLIEIPINKSGLIEVKYTGTTLQSVCWYITIISILLLAAYIVMNRRRKTSK